MKRPNCWEFKQCGREPGGLRANQLGVCPAAKENASSGMNRGKHAGRYCWRVAGTFCEGKLEGMFAAGLISCSHCDFYRLVQEEEGDALKL